MQKNKTFFKKKWVERGIIFTLLILLWFFLTFWLIAGFDTSFSVLSYNYGKGNFTNLTYGKILAGQKISGEFQAQESNLGIVSIRFETGLRIPYDQEDIYVFRLKEKGQEKWYYENTYRSGGMYDFPFYPFGFPIIKDSKGKTYVFELQSLKGNQQNALSISQKGLILSVKYKESKKALLSNRELLMSFIFKKFTNSLQVFEIQFASFIYLLPFIFYFLWISPFKKYIFTPIIAVFNYFFPNLSKAFVKKRIKIWEITDSPSLALSALVGYTIIFRFDLIILSVILFDIFYAQLVNDLKYIIIVCLWIITIKIYRSRSSKTFFIALLFLFFSPILLEFKFERMAEEAASWSFILLFVSVAQMIFELIANRSLKNSR
jgi:hypothetical protein